MGRFMVTVSFASVVVLGGCVGEEAPVDTTQSALSIGPKIWDQQPWGQMCNMELQTCTMDGVTMHCCPTEWAMVGAHFAWNEFRCGYIGGPESCFLDTSTVRNGMKACPVGSYMKGHHKGQNKSICCNYPSGKVATSSRIDGDNEPANQAAGTVVLMTQTNPCCYIGIKGCMSCPVLTCEDWSSGHSCFDNEVMVGVHIANNYFICES